MDRTLEQRLTEFLDREDRKIEEERRNQARAWRAWLNNLEAIHQLHTMDEKFREAMRKADPLTRY